MTNGGHQVADILYATTRASWLSRIGGGARPFPAGSSIAFLKYFDWTDFISISSSTSPSSSPARLDPTADAASQGP